MPSDAIGPRPNLALLLLSALLFLMARRACFPRPNLTAALVGSAVPAAGAALLVQ